MPVRNIKQTIQIMTNETTKKIIDYLNANDCHVWRQNNYGKGRRNVTKRGVPDIIGLKYNGTFIGIEIKTGTDKLSQAQLEMQELILAHNGIYIVAKDFETFLKLWNL
jgi:Holliday junction resolvase